MIQNSIPGSRAAGLTARRKLIRALQPAATTTPVSSRRAGDQTPWPRARAKTRSMENRAPRKAAALSQEADSPSSIESRAPVAAPPETPRIYGSPRGLRSKTWIRAPESASSPPTANALSARGRRNSLIRRCSNPVSDATRASQICPGAISTLPTESASARLPRPSRARPESRNRGRQLCWFSALPMGDHRRRLMIGQPCSRA